MRIRVFLLILLLLMVSGCATPSKDFQPPIHMPDKFTESGAEMLPEKWWFSLNDPDINRLIEQALDGNMSLKISWDRLAQSTAIARKAVADLYPSLDVEGGASRTREQVNSISNTRKNYSLGAAASYELDLWGRVRAGRDAAALDLYASREDLMTAAITISTQVASTWYQLVEQYGQRKLLTEQVVTNKKVLEVVTFRFQRGQAPAADVLQQRQLVESNQGEKAQVESRIKVLEHQLAVLLGSSPTQTAFNHVTEYKTLPPLPQAGLPTDLIQRRPDMRSAFYSVQASDKRVAEAIANRFPRISLTGQVGTSGVETRDLFDNWLRSIAANLMAPIVDGGSRRAEVARTRAVASEKLHNYGLVILNALEEVENALVKEKYRRKYINSLDKQLKLSFQAIERIRDRYTKGAEDYLRVLAALSTHQQLQRTRLSAGKDLVQDRIDLCKALAGGWEIEKDSGLTEKNGPQHSDDG